MPGAALRLGRWRTTEHGLRSACGLRAEPRGDLVRVIDATFRKPIGREGAADRGIAAEQARRVPAVRLALARRWRGRHDELRPYVIPVRGHAGGHLELHDEVSIFECEARVRPHEPATVVRAGEEVLRRSLVDAVRRTASADVDHPVSVVEEVLGAVDGRRSEGLRPRTVEDAIRRRNLPVDRAAREAVIPAVTYVHRRVRARAVALAPRRDRRR